MSIKVKFFASLRDWSGCSSLELESEGLNTAADVLAASVDTPPDSTAVLCAVNFETVSLAQAVSDGDEVAFFPPVTGG